MNKIEKSLLKLAIPHYINGVESLRSLVPILKILGMDYKTKEILTALVKIGEICQPFNTLRKEIELELDKIQAED